MARPSKLTPEVQEIIVKAIGLGASYKDAAAAANVDYNTFNEWRKKGEAQKSGAYREFNEAIEKEQSAAVLRHLSIINSAAAKGDWKASERWLRMYRPAEWNEKMEVNHGGEQTLTIKIQKASDGNNAESQ